MNGTASADVKQRVTSAAEGLSKMKINFSANGVNYSVTTKNDGTAGASSVDSSSTYDAGTHYRVDAIDSAVGQGVNANFTDGTTKIFASSMGSNLTKEALSFLTMKGKREMDSMGGGGSGGNAPGTMTFKGKEHKLGAGGNAF